MRRFAGRPGLEDLLRISVGLPEHNDIFLSALAATPAMNVAFLDRDGTLLWEPPETEQIDSLAKFRILPGVFEGLAALQRSRLSRW